MAQQTNVESEGEFQWSNKNTVVKKWSHILCIFSHEGVHKREPLHRSEVSISVRIMGQAVKTALTYLMILAVEINRYYLCVQFNCCLFDFSF